MYYRRLRDQFLLAGGLLVAATACCAFAANSVIVAVISGTAFLLALVVLVPLVRAVLQLIRDLTTALAALREGEFDRRVQATGTEELTRLAEGFNRLAEKLAENRRSSPDELRTELIAVVSHELKTPLTTLSLNLMMLSEWAENLTPTQRDIVAAAVVSCEELGETIDELLDLTRIEAGQLRLERSSVNLPALIAQTVQALRPRFDDSEITLCLVVDGPTAVLSGDASRLRIVFMNILTNALKYAPRNSTVTLRLSSGQNAGVPLKPVVQIAVTDSGPGVPSEYRERIFEKFFRVEHEQSNSRRMTKGAGVGLYLCRQIIEAHGGAIRCESAENGVGTRIAIDLPTEASASEQLRTPSVSS